MKKIILLAFIFAGLQGFAQKEVYYWNYSSYPVYIFDVRTIKETVVASVPPTYTYGYPTFYNTNAERGNAFIVIPASPSPGIIYNQYALRNPLSPTKFPFESVGNTPLLTSWKKVNTAGGTPLTQNVAQAMLVATPQVFHYSKVMVGVNGSAGGTTFSPRTPGLSGAGFGEYNDVLTSGTIESYDGITVITIFDN